MPLFLILSEKKEIKPLEALRESKKIMKGNKWKLFCLSWRFFGWALLCILTCGIGFFWLMPYMNVSFAKFYEDIKNKENKEATEENNNNEINEIKDNKNKDAKENQTIVEEKIVVIEEKFVPEELE